MLVGCPDGLLERLGWLEGIDDGLVLNVGWPLGEAVNLDGDDER